jgi:hypothetical protein
MQAINNGGPSSNSMRVIPYDSVPAYAAMIKNQTIEFSTIMVRK